MKTLYNKLFLIFASLLIFTSVVVAQHQQGPPKIPSPEEITNLVSDMTKQIKLNKDQSAKFEKLFNEHFDEVKERMNNDKVKINREKNNRDNHRKEFEDSLKELLSEEQKVNFDEFMKKRIQLKNNKQRNYPK